jgi:hypothetical protein
MSYLTEEQQKYYQPGVLVGNCVLKTVEEEDGTSADFVLHTPLFTWMNFVPVSYSWTITGIHSNFKNAIGYSTNADASLSYPDEFYPQLKISNIKEGEVVFVELMLECDGQEGEYAVNLGTIMGYRGDPINTKFKIFYAKNGKLCFENIYDSPIEKTINTVLDGTGMETNVADTVQGNRQTISEFLSEYDTLVVNKSLQELAEDVGATKTKTVQGQEKRLKPIVSSFIKDENAFYAHGRSIDIASVETLKYQNPANYFHKGFKKKPNVSILQAAYKNSYYQREGYNAFVNPLLNPFIPDQTHSYYFPGRSGHGTTPGDDEVCANTPKGDDDDPTYDGKKKEELAKAPTSQPFCDDDKCPLNITFEQVA